MTPRPPRLATALLRRFGPDDDAIAGDLLEGFQRRSGSKIWYWWQVGNAIRVAAVCEIGRHPIAVSAAVVFGWVVWWLLVYQIAFPVMFAADPTYTMWRMGQGYVFGPYYVVMSWMLPNAVEAITAVLAVRLYHGRRLMLALFYAGAVLARCVGSLTLNSIYYDPTANVLHYVIDFRSFPPLGIGTVMLVFPVPSLAALVGGMLAAPRQEMLTRAHQ